VELLISSGSNPNEMESHGIPALATAARRGHVAVVDALIKHGADPNLRDRYVNGWTPLLHALHLGQRAAALAALSRRLVDGGLG
jgi:ankyrin repeat protein